MAVHQKRRKYAGEMLPRAEGQTIILLTISSKFHQCPHICLQEKKNGMLVWMEIYEKKKKNAQGTIYSSVDFIIFFFHPKSPI